MCRRTALVSASPSSRLSKVGVQTCGRQLPLLLRAKLPAGDATRAVRGWKFGAQGGDEEWEGACWEEGSFDRVLCDVPCSGASDCRVVVGHARDHADAAVSAWASTAAEGGLQCKAASRPFHVPDTGMASFLQV